MLSGKFSLQKQKIIQLQEGQVNLMINPKLGGSSIYNELRKWGISDCLLLSMDAINVIDSNTFNEFASEAYRLFVGNNLLSANMWVQCYNVLGHYGLALSSLFWGYDLKKEVMNLYTSSYSIIEYLARNNKIKPKKTIYEDLEKTKKELVFGTGMKKSLTENSIQCTKLTPLISNGQVKFEMTRAKLNLKDTLIVPDDAYKAAVNRIKALSEQGVVRITMGDKVRDITTYPIILETVYGSQRKEQLMRNHIKMFNTLCKNLYFPSLGASVYTFGLTNIKLEYIDRIQMLNNISEVDLSEIHLDLSDVKEFFFKRVRKFKAKEYRELLSEVGLDSQNMTLPELKEQVKEMNKWYDNEIWNLMKKLPKLFNTKEYTSQPKKYGSNLKGVQVPRSTEELENLFKEGLYKICVQYSSKGKETKLYTKYVSNDEKVLKKYMGASYYGKYESLGNRLRKLQSYCRSKNATKDRLEKLIKSLKLQDEIGDINNFNEVMNKITELLAGVKESTTVVKHIDNVVVRNLKPQENKYGKLDYYINVKPENIVEIYKVE